MNGSKALTSPRVVAILAVAMVAAGVSQGFGRFTYSLLLTDVRDGFGVSNTVAGSLGSANLIAYLIGSLGVSLVVGRVGLAVTARIGVSASTIGLALLAWGPTVAVVAGALLLTGVSGALVWITVPGIAASELGPSRRGAAIGIVGAGVGLGLVAASLLHTTVAADDWHDVYRIEAAIGAVTTLAALGFLRGGAPARRGLPGLRALRIVPRWRNLLWSYGLFALSISMFLAFLVAVLEEDAGWSAGRAGLAFSAAGFGTIAGGPIFGPLSDRIGRLPALRLALALIAVTAVLVPIGSEPLSLVGAFCFGIGFTGGPTTIGARISDHVTAEDFGAAYGVATLAFGAGLAVAPQLGGVIRDVTGSFRPAFAVITVCSIGAGLLSMD
ncbi:MAG: YbfB/YjiJ family MFS transporter [Actinomycetia bacterium]|nr:YbfB/YjiJ family MFS transporter [Actinomycetes bacterium]MCP3913703.1 YbfB/YjiJ family MFS transporter [Actinomycetes bacterium]